MYPFKLAAVLGVPAFALITYLATGCEKSYAQSPAGALSNATIGAQVLGRVRILPDFSVKLYGYFTYMAGVPGPLFSGAPSENTAMLTFSADPTAAALIRNGDVTQAVETPVNGQYTVLSVYYNANPTGRDILNPDDFTEGQLIATFRSSPSVVNISASGPGSGSFLATGGISYATSNFFFINNQPVNLSNLANALNLTLFGPAPSFDTMTAGLLNDGSVSIPLAGTGYVVGSSQAPLVDAHGSVDGRGSVSAAKPTVRF